MKRVDADGSWRGLLLLLLVVVGSDSRDLALNTASRAKNRNDGQPDPVGTRIRRRDRADRLIVQALQRFPDGVL